jgi:hypothetical protein
MDLKAVAMEEKVKSIREKLQDAGFPVRVDALHPSSTTSSIAREAGAFPGVIRRL